PPSWTIVTRIGSPGRKPRSLDDFETLSLTVPRGAPARGRLRSCRNKLAQRRFVMPTRKLDKKEWRSFLDRLSTTLEGKEAEIEVVSLQLGDQVEADWLRLLGIAYDPNDDIVEVALEDLDHLIAKPRELYVEEGAGGLAALEIVDSDDVKQIIKLRDPLMLPAPPQAR